jgi:hypothetical protein
MFRIYVGLAAKQQLGSNSNADGSARISVSLSRNARYSAAIALSANAHATGLLAVGRVGHRRFKT